MTSKRWCFSAASVFAVVMVFIMAFNFATDAFGVFGDALYDEYSYNMTNNPRTSKIAYLERELKKNPGKYDSYILGCSSTSSFDTEGFSEAMGAKFYNMIMYGADMADVEKTAKYLVENHTVKNMVLNVYLGNVTSYDTCPDELTYGLHPSVSGESAAKFYVNHLFANPEYAFDKAKFYANTDEYLSLPADVFDVETGEYDKRKRDAESVSTLERYYRSYPEFVYYPKYNYTMPFLNECMDSVGRIKDMCDAAGVKLIVVTAPVYGEYFAYYSKGDIGEFYKRLSEVTGGFWDFAVSPLSYDPRFFYDATHFKNDLGRMMVSKMFSDYDTSRYIHEDFGAYVTSENAAERVEEIYTFSFDDSEYTEKLPVLLYHHLDEELSSPDTITPKAFRRQMELLKKLGYETVTVKEVISYIDRGTPLPEKSIMITFDDGYLSNLTLAGPILREYGFEAVIFAIGSGIGARDSGKSLPHFTLEEAAEYADVFEIESHSYARHNLKGTSLPESMLPAPGEDSFKHAESIKLDCEKQKEALGKNPSALAFPHGKNSVALQAVLNETGIRLTFDTEYATPVLIKGLSQSGYSMGRYTMYEGTSDATIEGFLSR